MPFSWADNLVIVWSLFASVSIPTHSVALLPLDLRTPAVITSFVMAVAVCQPQRLPNQNSSVSWTSKFNALLERLVENELESIATGIPASTRYADAFATITQSVTQLMEAMARLIAMAPPQPTVISEPRIEVESNPYIQYAQPVSDAAFYETENVWESQIVRAMSHESMDLSSPSFWSESELLNLLTEFLAQIVECSNQEGLNSLPFPSLIEVYLEDWSEPFRPLDVAFIAWSLLKMLNASFHLDLSSLSELSFSQFAESSTQAKSSQQMLQNMLQSICPPTNIALADKDETTPSLRDRGILPEI